MATNEELIAQGTSEYLEMMAYAKKVGVTISQLVQRLPLDTPDVPEEPPPNVEEPVDDDPSGEDPTTPAVPTVGPFSPEGKYAWMNAAGTMPPIPPAETGAFPIYINSNQSDKVADLTGVLSDRTFVGTSQDKGWGEHGPKWLVRGYNVRGTIANLSAYRVGDFHKGREGHVLYLNVYGDLVVRNFRAVQCGGQAMQVVWRDSETRIAAPPPTIRTILLEGVEAVDCGAINEGVAVRASWPFSFYSTGHSIHVDGMRVRTKLAGFEHPGRAGVWQSHGGLFIGHGQTPRVTPEANVEGLDIGVWNSDRECVRLWDIAEASLYSPRIVNHGGQPTVAVVDDCGYVLIDEPEEDLVVKIHHAHKPYSMAYEQITVSAGTTWDRRF